MQGILWIPSDNWLPADPQLAEHYQMWHSEASFLFPFDVQFLNFTPPSDEFLSISSSGSQARLHAHSLVSVSENAMGKKRNQDSPESLFAFAHFWNRFVFLWFLAQERVLKFTLTSFVDSCQWKRLDSRTSVLGWTILDIWKQSRISISNWIRRPGVHRTPLAC